MDSKKILLVDDDAVFRLKAMRALESRGCEVREAHTGLDGMNIAKVMCPDLIVVDGLLPDTTGMSWISEYRQFGTRTPIIFASAFWKDIRSFEQLTRELNVSWVVQKPVPMDLLVQRIGQLLNLAEPADSLTWKQDSWRPAAVHRSELDKAMVMFSTVST